MTNLSFNNDPALKSKHIAQAERHAAADMLIAGIYVRGSGQTFQGCSVGCFAHEIDPDSDDYHNTVAEARGLPEWLIHLQDSIFEGIPAEERKDFHVELAKRIPVGVDLEPVKHLIAIARMDRLLEVQQRTAPKAEHLEAQVIEALELTKRAHESALSGDTSLLKEAESATESAAKSAAESAAWSVAWSAEWSAAESAKSAAESAAKSAAESAGSAAWSAWSAARSAARAALAAALAAWPWRDERDALFAALARLGGEA